MLCWVPKAIELVEMVCRYPSLQRLRRSGKRKQDKHDSVESFHGVPSNSLLVRHVGSVGLTMGLAMRRWTTA